MMSEQSWVKKIDRSTTDNPPLPTSTPPTEYPCQPIKEEPIDESLTVKADDTKEEEPSDKKEESSVVVVKQEPKTTNTTADASALSNILKYTTTADRKYCLKPPPPPSTMTGPTTNINTLTHFHEGFNLWIPRLKTYEDYKHFTYFMAQLIQNLVPDSTMDTPYNQANFVAQVIKNLIPAGIPASYWMPNGSVPPPTYCHPEAPNYMYHNGNYYPQAMPTPPATPRNPNYCYYSTPDAYPQQGYNTAAVASQIPVTYPVAPAPGQPGSALPGAMVTPFTLTPFQHTPAARTPDAYPQQGYNTAAVASQIPVTYPVAPAPGQPGSALPGAMVMPSTLTPVQHTPAARMPLPIQTSKIIECVDLTNN